MTAHMSYLSHTPQTVHPQESKVQKLTITSDPNNIECYHAIRANTDPRCPLIHHLRVSSRNNKTTPYLQKAYELDTMTMIFKYTYAIGKKKNSGLTPRVRKTLWKTPTYEKKLMDRKRMSG